MNDILINEIGNINLRDIYPNISSQNTTSCNLQLAVMNVTMYTSIDFNVNRNVVDGTIKCIKVNIK